MQYEITDRPSSAVLELTLAEGEQIQTQAGAMMTKSAGIGNQTSVGGGDGVAGTMMRAVSDERQVVENTYWAESDDETITLAPNRPGDIFAVNVSEAGPIKAQSGGLLAWEPLVERSTEFNNSSNIFSSGELTVLGLGGRGHAFLSACGSLRERSVEPGEPVVVDEDHLVAWSGDLNLTRRSAGDVTSTVLGGEGFVTDVRGTGRLWLQTRNPVIFMPAGGNQ